jgi:hypothetical protein
LQGDVVLAAAYAHELPSYGIKHGLTNWSAGISFLIQPMPLACFLLVES